MSEKFIKVRGAAEHNLKNVNVDVPKDQLVVFTGLSGSGKSSLAFDTIYAEGQRRYMESLSSYTRQFLGQMEKPNVVSIDGLSPAISIDQKTTNRNPRSTVGTVTEIYDYLRLLYARIGIPHCPNCGKPIQRQSIDEMVDSVMKLKEGTKLSILALMVRGKKGRHEKLIESARRSGYSKIRVDGNLYDTDEEIELDKNIKHTIEIVVDRLVMKPDIEKRLTESMETALKLSDGKVQVEYDDGKTLNFSQSFSCPDCDISIEEIEPRSFSFNNPYGACPDCLGLGFHQDFDVDLIIPDRTLSINEGAINVYGWFNSKDESSWSHAMLKALAKEYKFSLDTPWKDLSKKAIDVILNGTNKELKVNYDSQWGGKYHYYTFEGLLENLRRRYEECASDAQKAEYEEFMIQKECKTCHGGRLKASSLAVTVDNKNIKDATDLSIEKFYEWVTSLTKGKSLSDREAKISEIVLKELVGRSKFLCDVGLNYLTLSRSSATLSGGESQRIRLASQVGTGLCGVTYVLDEPSIGLHQRDNDKLLSTLKNLRDLGNSVIVVEHDEDTIRNADYIVDIGPRAGVHGGEVVAEGSVEDLIKSKKSITGKYLSGELEIKVPKKRRKPEKFFKVIGARQNNLKNIDVDIPVGVFTVVTGVSGSGKSSLVNEIIYKALAKELNRSRSIPGAYKKIEGVDGVLDKIINIDQSPIGRTTRSNPATYTGVYDLIRDLFAGTKDARERGYTKGRFSFNVKGGRCEACEGDGVQKIEMHFLPDVYVTCDVCGGKRYNRETLEVKYKDKNIFDILDMTVEEALKFFENLPKIQRKIQTLYDVGLGYIKLGQSSTTLSGGEAQRIKLATELSKRPTGKTIYVLDEPTTGLHFDDTNKLIEILQKLADGGNTVLVIEHNLDVIKCADYIIDIGKESGDEGGEVIATGTPEEIAKNKISYTGKYLKKYLKS